MSKLTLSVAATVRPVTVEELKAHTRIDESDEDVDVLPALLDNAIEAAQGFTWRKLINQTWILYLDAWADPIKLPFGPVSSISSITYTDSNQASQTLATSVYELSEEDGIPVVRRKYNQDWPTVLTHKDVIAITFICGYGATATSVPERFKQAIKFHASWNFMYREGQPMPATFMSLLWPLRLHRWTKVHG